MYNGWDPTGWSRLKFLAKEAPSTNEITKFQSIVENKDSFMRVLLSSVIK